MIGQSNLGKKGTYVNTAPQILPAGKVTSRDDEGAKMCCAPDKYFGERPPTPPEIKKYRNSTVHEPGKTIVHYGLADDKINQETPFGSKTQSNDSVEEVIKNYPASELMQWRRERQEDIYASSKREPLGKSFSRGHKLPEELGSEVPFGVGVDAKNKDKNPVSKGIIYPVERSEVDPTGEAHTQYVKTHGDYAPGEQRRRGYDWAAAGVDPAEQTFGTVEHNPYREGVAKALNPGKDDDYKNSAQIVEKRLEDFKMTANDELGRVKNLGHGEKPVDHIYGVPSRRFEEWGVRRLIKGDYPEEEQNPDPDLGKSLRKGYRNIPPHEQRVFGAPTIRTDIPGPKTKSVADNQNYGNEPDASNLIYPAGGAERGVVEQDYLSPYTKEQMREFYSKAGVEMDDTLFESSFTIAADMDKFPGGEACINTFQRVRMYNMRQMMG